MFRCLLISLKVFIWQLTHFVKQRCFAVVFKCARKYSSSTLFHSLDHKYWNIDAWNWTLTVNLWIKIQLKRSRFVWPSPHIVPAVIFCETFPALLVSEESSESLEVPSARFARKGYSIVSNSTLVETNVIFSPWTKQVMNWNCLLWPQIAKNKVLGLLQPIEARELGESFAELMATPSGVWWIFHDNADFSDSYPVFAIYLEAGIARRIRGTESGKRDRSKRERWWEGRKQISSFPTRPALPLLTAPLSLMFIGDWETTCDESAAFYSYSQLSQRIPVIRELKRRRRQREQQKKE